MKKFLYKTVAIYPDLPAVSATLTYLEHEGFTPDQISLLGRQSEHLSENLELEWETFKTVEGTLMGAVIGSMPGLAIIAGVALTGGLGLIAAGPMVPGLIATGMGALSGGVVGGFYNLLTSKEEHEVDLEADVEAALCRGLWVIVVHTQSESEAAIALEALKQGGTQLDAHTTPEDFGLREGFSLHTLAKAA